MKTGDWIQAVSLILVTITVVGMMIQLRQVMAQTKLLGASSNHAVIESLVQASWLPRAAFFMDEPELMRWHLTMRGVCKDNLEDNKKHMYVLAKLDLHESNYMNHQAGALGDELWDAWVRTLSDDFKFKEYRECWPIVKHHYAASFAKFVDDKIMPVVAWDAVGDSPGP